MIPVWHQNGRAIRAGLRALLAVGLTTLATIGASCGSGGGSPTTTPATVAAPETAVPSTVSDIIHSVVSQDVSATVSRFTYQRMGCVALEQEGSPPLCPTGIQPGTEVDAFLIGGCGGVWETSDKVPASLSAILSSQPFTLYAVFRPKMAGSNKVDYRVLFAFTSGTPREGFWIDVRDNKITAVNRTCEGVVNAVNPGIVGQFFVAPPTSIATP